MKMTPLNANKIEVDKKRRKESEEENENPKTLFVNHPSTKFAR
jgi:hypothetical protein